MFSSDRSRGVANYSANSLDKSSRDDIVKFNYRFDDSVAYWKQKNHNSEHVFALDRGLRSSEINKTTAIGDLVAASTDQGFDAVLEGPNNVRLSRTSTNTHDLFLGPRFNREISVSRPTKGKNDFLNMPLDPKLPETLNLVPLIKDLDTRSRTRTQQSELFSVNFNF